MKYNCREVGKILLKCLISFYAIYYGIGSVLFAGFRLKKFDGKIPFNFQSWIDLTVCCMSYPSEQQVNVISMVISYAVSGVVFGILILHRVWDFAITVTLIHILLSCLVCLDWPMNWSWWVCLGSCLIIMISLGEAVSFLRRKLNKSQVQPTPQEPESYLYRKT